MGRARSDQTCAIEAAIPSGAWARSAAERDQLKPPTDRAAVTSHPRHIPAPPPIC